MSIFNLRADYFTARHGEPSNIGYRNRSGVDELSSFGCRRVGSGVGEVFGEVRFDSSFFDSFFFDSFFFDFFFFDFLVTSPGSSGTMIRR
jgi:hypothetical protein